jgi:DNA helicase II / ATP-dependent DNA helicase PcrA
VNPTDTASLRRVINYPTRGIGDRSQQQLAAYAAREGVTLWEALASPEQAGLGPRAQTAVERFRSMIVKHGGQAKTFRGDELARMVIEETGILLEFRQEKTQESLVRWENVQELINAIAEFAERSGDEGTLSAFLQEVSLLTDADSEDGDTNRVTLMTLHASKGLEFAVVFVTGLEEGLFPLAASAQDRKDLEEERRLLYVGVTRAQDRLYLSYARSRFRYGVQESSTLSRFVEEIEGEDLIQTEAGGRFEPRRGRFKLPAGAHSSYAAMDPHYYRKSLRSEVATAAPTSPEPVAPEPEQRRVVYEEGEGSIVPGARVEHRLFGEGKVLSLDGVGTQAKAVVFFHDVGQKKLVLRFAGLRRIA